MPRFLIQISLLVLDKCVESIGDYSDEPRRTDGSCTVWGRSWPHSLLSPRSSKYVNWRPNCGHGSQTLHGLPGAVKEDIEGNNLGPSANLTPGTKRCTSPAQETQSLTDITNQGHGPRPSRCSPDPYHGILFPLIPIYNRTLCSGFYNG